MSARRAAILTVSDGVSHGTRTDESGAAVERILRDAGYETRRMVVADESEDIKHAVHELAEASDLVVTTGGTGFGPRDVTPEATRSLLEREAPGLAEAMRAAGRAITPFADMSRGVAGTVGTTIVINLPGSPKGAVESLEAVLPVLSHALEHVAGHTEHTPS
jgi:molybdenum cofactor synthesis domain-containing protein